MSLQFISYCRKSSKGKTKQLESIADQEKALKEIIDREHLHVVIPLSEARSAKEPYTRPVFREMLEAIKRGEANAILCWHLNRLSRNELESGELQWLLRTGVIKCIKTPEREYRPEDHGLLMAVETSNASQYVRDLKRDVERGVMKKAQRGWYPYKPKAGYLLEPLSKDLTTDPERFPLLRRAWELMLTGSYSVPQILRELNSWGYRGPRTKTGGGKTMKRSGLYRLFNDAFYAGRYTVQGELFVGKHTPMVTTEEFTRVQRLLGNTEHAKPQKFFHAYAGLIHCGSCGCIATVETKVKRGKTTGRERVYTYYHCTGRKGCRKLSVTEDEFEQEVLTFLEDCRLEPSFIDWALEVLKREEADAHHHAKSVQSASTNSERALKRKLETLFAMREDGEISREEFLERKRRHEMALSSLKTNEDQRLSAIERNRQELQRTLVLCRDGYKRFVENEPEGRRLVMCEFGLQGVLTLGIVGIKGNPALDKIRLIEPPKSHDSQIKPGHRGAYRPAWRALLDELRQIIANSDGYLTKPTHVPHCRSQRDGWEAVGWVWDGEEWRRREAA